MSRRERPNKLMADWGCPSLLTALLLLGVVVAPVSSVAAEQSTAATKPLDAKLVSVEGKKLTLSEVVEGPTLLDLWATWCLPCQEQGQVLAALKDELREQEVSVVALNVGEKSDVVVAYLRNNPNAHAVFLDRTRTIPTRLRLLELPALVLLRADRTVSAIAIGLTDREGVLALLATLDEK